MSTAMHEETTTTARRLRPPGTEPPEAGLRRTLRNGLDRNVFTIFVLAGLVSVHTRVVQSAIGSDTWYTLLGGSTISNSGLPRRDTLTVFTLGRRWVDQQWLAQLGFYELWAGGGWRLAITIVVVLFLAAFAVLAAAARRLGASDRAVALAAFACYLVAITNAALRAQTLAYVLFAIVLGLLVADARAPSRRVYLVFPVLALWANIHGSVLLGAALVALRGATVAGSALRRRAAPGPWLPRAAVLCVTPWLCSLVSPYGTGLVHYYRSVLGNTTFERVVNEWGPSTIRSEPLFFVLLFGGLWLAIRARAAVTPFERLALAATGLLGLLAIRNVVWFALVGTVVLPFAVDALWNPSKAERRPALNVMVAAAGVTLAVAATVAMVAHGRAWFEQNYPRKAAAAVARVARSNPRVRVFANETFADWLLFEDPQLSGRVAYDVRFELLTGRQLSSLAAFRREQGLDWQRAARGYGVLVLDPVGDAGAVKYFRQTAGAKVLYRDSHVVVLQRGG